MHWAIKREDLYTEHYIAEHLSTMDGSKVSG